MNITLKCPQCTKGVALTCMNDLEGKVVECPTCHQKMKCGDLVPKFSLKVDGTNYQLHLGRQWVGRKHPNSDTEIQIPDETNYMSRKHAIVELKCTTAGIAITYEEHGKNPTELQGIPLDDDDIIYLNVNDCLTLGGRKMYLANEFAE